MSPWWRRVASEIGGEGKSLLRSLQWERVGTLERRGEEEYLGKEVSIKEFVDKEQKTQGVQESRSSRVQESGVQGQVLVNKVFQESGAREQRA